MLNNIMQEEGTETIEKGAFMYSENQSGKEIMYLKIVNK